MKRSSKLLTLFCLAVIACDSDGNGNEAQLPELPDVSTAVFVSGVTNPYFPLPVGRTWVYEAQTDEGLERIEVKVLAASDPMGTKVVQGVNATVVRDTVTLDGEVIEDTWDWFAQDADGNVWYLGEDTCEFEGGMCVNRVGAWEWGMGEPAALPGIVMPAVPSVNGKRYYQEYFIGEAEDAGEVVELGVSVMVAAGSFTDCIKTHETSTLDLDLDEFKYYCRDIGLVLIEEPDVSEELVQYSG